jgi:hypothetical protein
MTTIATNQKIILIIDAELALEIERELELEREDQFVLEQIELDDGVMRCTILSTG